MATLTTSWKSYASASFSSGSATITFYLEAKYSSQSIANNTTAVQTRLRSAFTSGNSLSGAGYKFTCTYANTVSGSGTWHFANEVITNGSSTVTHNSNGTKSISLSASAYNKYWGFTKSLSATVSLPTIPRQATIKSAPNFNDEQNPTITYSNPAGNSVTTLKAGIFSTNGYTAYASYRNISKTGTSYTFNLTDAERNTLRNATANSNTLSVRFYVQTVIGGNTYTSYLTKTLTIINATPTFTYTKEEQNNDVITYLGSGTTSVIQNISNVRFTATPTAYKGASISKFEVTNGSNILNAQSPYQIDMPITANITTLKIVDSRGNIATETFEPTFIEYQNVKQNSFSFKRLNPTSSDVKLTLDSAYYQQTFGTTPNVPTVKWKLDDEANWHTISSSQYTIDTENNKLTLDYTINDIIDYRDRGTFYVEVSDLLSSWNNNNVVSKGIPVMEWGDDEVQINGDLYLADINRENAVNVRDIVNQVNYTSTEQEVGTWLSKKLYRIVITSTTKNFTSTTHTIGTLNASYTMVMVDILFHNTSNSNEYLIGNSNSTIYHDNGNINVQLTSAWGTGYMEAVVYYTKD